MSEFQSAGRIDGFLKVGPDIEFNDKGEPFQSAGRIDGFLKLMMDIRSAIIRRMFQSAGRIDGFLKAIGSTARACSLQFQSAGRIDGFLKAATRGASTSTVTFQSAGRIDGFLKQRSALYRDLAYDAFQSAGRIDGFLKGHDGHRPTGRHHVSIRRADRWLPEAGPARCALAHPPRFNPPGGSMAS